MGIFETIFIRRSVRKYDMTPLATEVLADIKMFLDGSNQIAGQKAWFEIVDAKAVTDDKAPHYIMAYCSAETSQYINVGYTLQNVDLYLQSKGLGSLWLGMAKPEDNEDDERGKDFCIMMAFGKTDVPQRESQDEFKRLAISKISDQDNAIAQAARLAPSAMNSQPWKLKFDSGKVTVEYCGRGLLKAMLKKKMNKIDLGIVTRHVELALQHDGKQVTGIKILNEKKPAVEITYTVR